MGDADSRVSYPSFGAPGVMLELTVGRSAAAAENEHIALHDEVAGANRADNANKVDSANKADHATATDNTADTDFGRRLAVWRRQPGFVLAEARHGGYLVGYACGLPLRPSTDWWRDVTAPLPASLTDERPGRTFALTQLLVRSSWRRQGIGAELLALLLTGRDEERATVKLPAAAAAAHAVFRNWGWTRVARSQAPAQTAPTAATAPTAPVFDILTRPLTPRT